MKSIVLVTVDCLRSDHVGFMGYSRPTTPFLDSLAAESFVIPAAIVAGAPTYYSLPAILGSRYPLALGRDVIGLAPEEPTIASVLNDSGYATALFSAGNPYIAARFGYERGFEKFRDSLEMDAEPLAQEFPPTGGGQGWASRLNRKLQQARPAMGPLGLVYDELYFRYCQRVAPSRKSLDALRRFPSADAIVQEACSWLESVGDKPCFLWLHLMDPHSPYYPKEEALCLMGGSVLTPKQARYVNAYWNRSDLGPGRLANYRHRVMALYDAGIRWADTQLSRLFDRLKKSNRWNDCVFAVTADHGEEFLDHGGRYHPPSDLKEELIHVPLLLRVPGQEKKSVSRAPFSLLDLAPTLLDAGGMAVPGAFAGTSRWSELKEGTDWGAAAITESVAACTNPLRREGRLGPRALSVREERFKIILHFEPFREQLYDLEADPGEQAPLPPTAQLPVRRRLLERARNHVQGSIKRRDQRARLQARIHELRLEWMRSHPQNVTIRA